MMYIICLCLIVNATAPISTPNDAPKGMNGDRERVL